jgi:hypothetical protein
MRSIGLSSVYACVDILLEIAAAKSVSLILLCFMLFSLTDFYFNQELKSAITATSIPLKLSRQLFVAYANCCN